MKTTTHILNDAEDIANIQLSVNPPKRELMRLAREMEDLSARRAKALNKIIDQLEAWQNK